jgi:membrane protease YdiL (CAAX protease family)/Tfp pilus assembly protein PilF
MMAARSLISHRLAACFWLAGFGQFINLAADQPSTSEPNEPRAAAAPATTPTASGFLKLGMSYYRSRDYAEAIDTLGKAISLEPMNSEANLWLGYSYYAQRQYESAASAFRTAAHARPEEARAHFWLGETLYILKRYEDAAASFKKALSLPTNTNQATAWFGLGRCQYLGRAYDSAAESFRQSTSVQPSNYYARVWLGYSLVHLNRDKAAAAAFEQALRLDAEGFDANLWAGLLFAKQGRFAEAIPNLERARASRPAEQKVRWLLFAAYLATGQTARIPGLHLGVFLPMSIVALGFYLAAAAWAFLSSLRPQAKSWPGFRFVLAWSGLIIVGQTVMIFVPAFFFSWPISQAVGVGLSLSALPLIAAALLGFARQPWGSPFAWPPSLPGGKVLVAVFGALLGALLIEGVYEWVVERVTGKPMPEQMIVRWLTASGQNWPWFSLLAIVLVGPAAEEILFRGLLFGAIRHRLSAGWTIVLTAGVFAVAHLQPFYLVPMFVIGVVLGWARHKSGGVAVPIVAHCLNNCFALFIVLQHPVSR